MNTYKIIFFYKNDIPIVNGVHYIKAESVNEIHEKLLERYEKRVINFPENFDKYTVEKI